MKSKSPFKIVEIRKEMQKWKDQYPQLLSVYVEGGAVGDMLIIEDKEFVLMNHYIAMPVNRDAYEYLAIGGLSCLS